MKTKNKKNIGILLVAIMVISVFVAVMPAFGGWHPPGAKGINLLTPVQEECVQGYVNITWDVPITNWTMFEIASYEVYGDWCFRSAAEPKKCDPDGCTYMLWKANETAGWPGQSEAPTCVEDVRIQIYNSTIKHGVPNYLNGTNLSLDNVAPCVECNSPKTDKWYNYSTIKTVVKELNVSACDSCCGLHNVTADLGFFYADRYVQFSNTSIPTGKICKDYAKWCYGHYYNFSLTKEPFKINTTYCGLSDYTVTARDNATDKFEKNNTQTCTLRFGFDDTRPLTVSPPSCTESPGAITVTWAAVTDVCSGVEYYNVYGYDLVDKNIFYAGKTEGTETEFVYTGNKAKFPDAEYCHDYQFNISAVDKAGNEGVQSNSTEAQHLTQGPPAEIDLWVKDELEGCGQKHNDSVIEATVKDAYEVEIGNVAVCFNTTDGQVCPTQEKTASNGVASVAYTTPKVVLEPYNVTVCAWVCDDESLVECKNILIIPKQATKAIITADPDMIATNGSTSLITVQLVDRLGNPVAGSGNMDVTVTTTAGKFNSTGTKTASGKIAAGKFTATLVSGTTPTLATVSADVGALYFPSTTVTFVGFGSYDIPLCEGWNLISLPLVPYDEDAGIVLSGIAGNLSFACAYDGWTGNWTFGSFIPPLTWSGDLDTMNVLRGYWLYMDTPATLTVTGYTMVPGPFLPETLWVNTGWNLVGYYVIPPDKVMTAGNYYNVAVNYNMLGYDCESQGYFAVGANDNLGSGKGYWMNANAIGEITPQEWL